MLLQGCATSRGELQRSLQYMSRNRQSRTAEAQAARCLRQLADLRVLVSDDSKESVVVVDRYQRSKVHVECIVWYFLQLAHPKVLGSNFISKFKLLRTASEAFVPQNRVIPNVDSGVTKAPDKLLRKPFFQIYVILFDFWTVGHCFNFNYIAKSVCRPCFFGNSNPI